ncbi:MAG: alkaline phosphatase family protein [Planctomycetes bacterium]|nr:alkaline phosphatase family protein [Planctomycetota bacterium]
MVIGVRRAYPRGSGFSAVAALGALVFASAPAIAAEFRSLLVPGNAAWVETGLWIAAGQTIAIQAGGEVQFRRPSAESPRDRCRAGPAGTYFFDADAVGRLFPLPAAGAGPAPCYALVGKIGERGPPFYVGARMSLAAEQSGPLYLGVNDFHHADNAGHFTVAVELDRPLQPVRLRRRKPADLPTGRPIPRAKVVIFYVDGLRPDVVEEMSAMGHLPHITQIFLEGGTHVENSLTVFPSNTITANGSMWTGCFSDRHGLKAQVGFDRKRGRSENYLETLGPVTSGLLLDREGADRVALGVGALAVRATSGLQAAEDFVALHTSNVPALGRHLTRHGKTYGAGVLPIMSDLSPRLWTRYLADEAPYLGTQKADRFIDEANTVYAIEHLLRQQDDVMIVWLPETDTVSHHEFRGQFGMARRTIAEADQMIGEVVGHVRRQGRLDKTYLILVSDHGHHGGRFEHLDRFDLANEFFHRPRERTADGRWVGGGLGLTVRQHRWINKTRGDGPRQFVFVEALGDGVARVFLPHGGFESADWSGPNAAGELMQYRVSSHAPPVDLIRMLAHVEAHDVRPEKQFPIDLVLAKIDDCSVLVHHRQRGWAVIDRRRDDEGRWFYRYRVVEDVSPAAGGTILYRESIAPPDDPLQLSAVLPPDLLHAYHDERTWLHLTLATPYPDSVVAMTRHLLWEERLRPREVRFAPDLVVCASPGWQFNTFNEPGTAHGHPFHATMRSTLFVAGPNVRRGAVLSAPARAVDLTPTVLAMVGVEFDPRHFDGRPLWTLFEPKHSAFCTPHSALVEPRYWRDVDLSAWHELPFQPRPEYSHQPLTINRPRSFWDLSNIVYNTLSLAEVSVNRLIDDAATALGSGEPPARTLYRQTQAALEAQELAPRVEGDTNWLAEATQSLHWNKIAAADYNLYSTANLIRMDAAVDWSQRRLEAIDGWVCGSFGLPARGAPIVNGAIDVTQFVMWETRRVGTRALAFLLSDVLLHGAEDGVDRAINYFRAEPPEVLVPNPPPQRLPQVLHRLPRLQATPPDPGLR